jgi:hypothetical protein
LGVTYLPQSGGTANGQWDLIPDRGFEGKIALGSLWRALKGKKVFKKKNAFFYPLESCPKGMSSPLPSSRSMGILRQLIPLPEKGLRNFWEDVPTAALEISL